MNKVKQTGVVEILRSQINFAPYNPRTISDIARKKLKANLETRGLMGGIVWNEQSGNIVAGHQRIDAIDKINRFDPESNKNDYTIRVEVVSLSDKEEKEQNLFMNNRAAQGEFDDDKLREMILDIDYTIAGYDDFDIDILGIGFAIQPKEEKKWTVDELSDEQKELNKQKLNEAEEKGNIKRDVDFSEDTPENQIARHAEIRKVQERIKNSTTEEQDGGALSYVVLTFQNFKQKEAFMLRFGFEARETYIDGVEFSDMIERVE